jgi:RNA polymerase primary sigma factor
LPSGLDDQQICKRLEVSELQLRNLRNALIAKRTTSLDKQLGIDGDGSCLGVILPDESTTLDFDQFQWDEVREILEAQEISDINNDLYLLRRNVVEGESLQSLADEIGRSRERIRQRVKTAKKRLAARLIKHRELVI